MRSRVPVRIAVALGAVTLVTLLVAAARLGPWDAGQADVVRALELRALKPGERLDDARLGSARTLETVCPFTPPETIAAWTARREALRRQVQVALGLWPMPERTPLNPRVTGTVARDTIMVEKIAFESAPGHFVTGNVYRPANRAGRLPAVLSPHGHWPGGRFQDAGPEEARAQVASGAEPFETSARFPLQARAVHLARMGAVVFLFDMLGYADSVQVPIGVAHQLKVPRPAMHGREAWGFFSPQAELRLQSPAGLQVWNALRALDYLASRPDVDPARIGVTGASGGGTQTFLIGALDPRPAALFPAVMVSTGMQGGCTCENASYLRIGTNNVEIAAMAAPTPLGLTAADDWTRDLETRGYPELQRVYGLLGAPEKVRLWPFLQFGHNYNGRSRAAMYEWFNTHLQLRHAGPVQERDFVPLSTAELSVWTPEVPPPPGGEEHERRLLARLAADADRQITSAGPLGVAREAVRAMIGRTLPPAGAIRYDERASGTFADHPASAGLLRYDDRREAVPAALLGSRRPGKGLAIWVGADGKAGALNGEAHDAIRELLDAGHEVLAIDVLHQGEHGAALDRVPLVSPRPHLGYTYGYNHPLAVSRAHDVLSAVRFARDRVGADGSVHLVAAGAGPSVWASLARAVAGDAVTALVTDTEGFRFAGIDRIDHPELVPGGLKYGDLPMLLALSTPHATWILGESEASLSTARNAFAAAAPARLRILGPGATLERLLAELP